MTIYGNLQFLLFKNQQQYPQSINIYCMPCVMKCLQIISSCHQHCNSGVDESRVVKMQQETSLEPDTPYFNEETTSVEYRIQRLKERKMHHQLSSAGSVNGSSFRASPAATRQEAKSARASSSSHAHAHIVLAQRARALSSSSAPVKSSHHRTQSPRLPSLTGSPASPRGSSPLTTSSPTQEEWFQSHEYKKMEKLKKENESLVHEKFLIQQNVYKLKNELVDLRTKYEQLLHLKPNTSSDIPALKEENQQLSKDLEKLRYQMDEQKRQVYESQLENEQLSKQVESITQNKEQINRELTQLRAQLEEDNKRRLSIVESREEKSTSPLPPPPSDEKPPSPEMDEKARFSKELYTLQDELFTLDRRAKLVKQINESIYTKAHQRGNTPHQGHCALMCLAVDFHNELWRNVGVEIMESHMMQVYERLDKMILDHNGYISHFTDNEEFVLSFDSAYDAVEFTLQWQDDTLLNMTNEKAFTQLKRFCPTVVSRDDSQLLLFKGVRYLSYVHVDYPQVRMDTLESAKPKKQDAAKSPKASKSPRRRTSKSSPRENRKTPVSPLVRNSDESDTLSHQIYFGELITDLTATCRKETRGGILHLSVDAWDEISHLSLDNSFTKSPLEVIQVAGHAHKDDSSTITCLLPKKFSQRMENLVSHVQEPREQIELKEAISRTEKRIQLVSTNIERIEEEEMIREEAHMRERETVAKSETSNIQSRLLQLSSKVEDPHELWNELKPELDTLTDRLVEQTKRVEELESVRDTLSPSKIRHLQQLHIQLERTQQRHTQIKEFMQSITDQQQRIVDFEQQTHMLEKKLQECNARIEEYERSLKEKSEELQNKDRQVERLQKETEHIFGQESSVFSDVITPSGKKYDDQHEKKLLEKLESLIKKGQAVLSMEENFSSKSDQAAFNDRKNRHLKDFLKTSLQAQLERSRNRCHDLKLQLEECRKSLKQVKGNTEKGTARQKELETQLGLAEKKILFMEQQIKKKNEEIDELKSKIDSLEYVLVVAEKKNKLQANKVRQPLASMGSHSPRSPIRTVSSPRGTAPGIHPSSPRSPRHNNGTSTSTLNASRLLTLSPVGGDGSVISSDMGSSSNDVITFDPKTRDPSFELQNDFQTVVFLNDHVYHSILGNTCWTSGKHSFTIHLDRASDNILVGVADMFHSSDKRVGETPQSWAISINTGSLFHSSGWKRYANRKIEKYIVVQLDLTRAHEGKGTISFILDGFSFGVAARNLRGAVSPAVSIYHRNDQVSIV